MNPIKFQYNEEKAINTILFLLGKEPTISKHKIYSVLINANKYSVQSSCRPVNGYNLFNLSLLLKNHKYWEDYSSKVIKTDLTTHNQLLFSESDIEALDKAYHSYNMSEKLEDICYEKIIKNINILHFLQENSENIRL